MGETGPIVKIPGGFLAKYPTTVLEWNRFCHAVGRTDTKPESTKDSGDLRNHPVTMVNFHAACDYAKWAGLGIPSEELWEHAARGNDGRLYPWGYEEPTKELCHSSLGTEVTGTAPVNAHPLGVSPYGVHDMAGNVWEWTSSFF